MNMRRIQRKRTKGWKMPENTVYVGRPSKWGNPYALHLGRVYERTVALRFYRKWLREKILANAHFLDELKGKDIACWCRLDEPCHADVILKKLKEELT